MSVSVVSMLFDGILACLLAVMIFYAVRLNRRILTLRERESEMQEMITQFNHSSAAAHASATALKSAGTEAEFGVKAAMAKAKALQGDLEIMIERGNAICERLDMQATDEARGRFRGASRAVAGGDEPVRRRPAPAARMPAEFPGDFSGDFPGDFEDDGMEPEAAPLPRAANVRPFAPPQGAAEKVVNAANRDDRESIEPRTEAERTLLAAIRAAKGGAA